MLDLPREHRGHLETGDLAGWNLRRLVWVADRGFASAANRAYLTRGGGHYIHAEKLRHTNTEAAAALACPGRYRIVAGNLRVKEVAVAPGGDDGARTQRFVICHNPEQADRDAAVRERLLGHLKAQSLDMPRVVPTRAAALRRGHRRGGAWAALYGDEGMKVLAV